MNAAAGEATSPVLMGSLVALMIGSTVFSFGYLKAKLERANSDYKKTKQSLPGLRKSYWELWASAMKVGVWVFVVGFILIAWIITDAKAHK
jgi:ABC-type Fe3+ transport system permease subunit